MQETREVEVIKWSRFWADQNMEMFPAVVVYKNCDLYMVWPHIIYKYIWWKTRMGLGLFSYKH